MRNVRDHSFRNGIDKHAYRTRRLAGALRHRDRRWSRSWRGSGRKICHRVTTDVFRVRAWLLSGGTVSRDDLRLLAYLGETHQEIELLREKVPALLGD